MQDELLNQLLAKRITNDLYDKKVLELNNRQQIIASELEAIAKSDESFYLTVSALLSVLSNTSNLFDSSRIEEKRRVLKFVFSNLEMNGSKLECTLNKPFDLLVKLPKCTEWRETLYKIGNYVEGLNYYYNIAISNGYMKKNKDTLIS